MKFIPFSRPEIGNNEITEVIEVMRSGWLTTGPKTKQFEDDFASFIGAEFAMAINSATAGLHLALEALGVKKGDKVITTVHTFTATAEVIRYLGAIPIFADIDPDSYCISPNEVEKLLKEHRNVKVVIPVHYAGQSCDMKSLLKLRKKYGFRILEDAAHALPTTYRGKMIGTIGDVTVFSFYANKTITTGEGGMVTTQDKKIASRIKIMRLHGISKDAFSRFQSTKPSWYYEVVAPGYKYNLSDIASAIGIHQLKKANAFRDKRQEIADIYNKSFNDLPVICPKQIDPRGIHAWHLYVLQLKPNELSISRDKFIELISKLGIGTSVHYIPLHQQPYWKDTFHLKDDDFPVSTGVSACHVSLPNFPGMMKEEVQYVVKSVHQLINEYIKK